MWNIKVEIIIKGLILASDNVLLQFNMNIEKTDDNELLKVHCRLYGYISDRLRKPQDRRDTLDLLLEIERELNLRENQ